MSYENATATKLLATHCICCGRPLVDAISVELGIGPECRNHDDAGISSDIQQQGNSMTHDAAIAAQGGRLTEILTIADRLDSIGLSTLAGKIRERFSKKAQDAVEHPDIQIRLEGDIMFVRTPYKRNPAFVDAWRSIPNRRYRDGVNQIPVASKHQLWELLMDFFPNKTGVGPKGPFIVPRRPKAA